MTPCLPTCPSDLWKIDILFVVGGRGGNAAAELIHRECRAKKASGAGCYAYRGMPGGAMLADRPSLCVCVWGWGGIALPSPGEFGLGLIRSGTSWTSQVASLLPLRSAGALLRGCSAQVH